MPCKFIAFKARSKRSASVFDVFSIWSFLLFLLKRQSVKQKFTPSRLCGSNFSCTIYRSQPLKERKAFGFVLVQSGHEAGGPVPGPITMLKADGWVGFVQYQSKADESAVTDSRSPAKASLPDSDCHVQQAVLLRWRIASRWQEAWLGAVRATQGHWQWHHSSRCPALSGTTVCIQTCELSSFPSAFFKVTTFYFFYFNEIGLLFVVL